ncbi:MAG: N-acetylneuraminate synthase [Prolixibacteraceae bacterium]|jgi:N,N'-diacetyllegionaminate synthase|nr:N-acetylneuraminate synthase [Prolixibacteraceae bacterium]MBT6007268.1 N-acetylneuraminate synthase [Prolixibacteraceae bacterium]MBT6767137.1 N-acetylneuraminate synthase [Prolixibacteraceae bacterium]MBT7000521.1 N-acetylneuraminate synthase [Prolixibacteraceae bacterium]MBT7393469.1 N-acetylneuraminate synthase [Prolixibacteraceae bacterium]
MGAFSFSKKIKVGDKSIGESHPVFIIAEAGVNHNGNLQKAKKLIDAAVESGADAVKFQAFKTENLILNNVGKAPYQKEKTGNEESQFEMLKKLEITKEQNQVLIEYARQKNIVFLSTPFDEESLDELVDLGVDAIKISSTDVTNLPFLKKVAKKGKPIFLSTGMCYLSEVEKALIEIEAFNNEVILLQCTANYPAKNDEANLAVLNTYKQHFDIILGYSDHTEGIGASPFSIPLGAQVVEKHFTLDRNDLGPDHDASLNPEQLIEYVKTIRKVESYMGTGIKFPSFDETLTRKSLQKCLVANIDIKKGDIFSEDMLVAKRTGGKGISPVYYKNITGEIAPKDFQKNDIIEIK